MKLSPSLTFNVKAFGAVGNGVANDTTAIQAAIDAAALVGGTVSLVGGEVYIIRAAGVKTSGGGSTVVYCLSLPSNVVLEGNGATIKLDIAQNAAMIVNDTLGSVSNVGISVRNLVLDGNQANQIPVGDVNAEQACLFFWGVELDLNNIKVSDAFQYAGRFLACKNSQFDRLSSFDSRGSGWSFGVSASSQEVLDSHIGSIHAEGSLGLTGYAVGNPVIITAKRMTVGSVTAKNNQWGFKVQDGSEDVNISSITVSGTVADNSVKIEAGPVRTSLGVVNVTGGAYAGLYIQDADYTTVNSYIGKNNTTAVTYPDVWVAGNYTQIAQIKSYGATTSGVAIRADALYYQLGDIVVVDAADSGVNIPGGKGIIGSITCRDTRLTPVCINALKITDSSADTTIVGDIKGYGLTGSTIQLLGGATYHTSSLLNDGPGISVKTYGAIGDGVTDDTLAIQAALNAVCSSGGTLEFPTGVYVFSSNLIANVESGTMPLGVILNGGPDAVLQPTVAVTTALTIGTAANDDGTINRLIMHGLRFDGVNTSGATCILAGENTGNLAGRISLIDVEIIRFLGAGGKGLYAKNLVGFHAQRTYIGRCDTGLYIKGSDTNLPTLPIFLDCQFRECTKKGVHIAQGYRVAFQHCTFEANYEEGFYVVPPGAGAINAIWVNLKDCWFEDNGRTGTQANNYHLWADGTAGTATVEVRDTNFSSVTRAMNFVRVNDFVLDNIWVQNSANQIVIDSFSQGTISNWPSNNVDYATVVNNVSARIHAWVPGEDVGSSGAYMDNIWASGAAHLGPVYSSSVIVADDAFVGSVGANEDAFLQFNNVAGHGALRDSSSGEVVSWTGSLVDVKVPMTSPYFLGGNQGWTSPVWAGVPLAQKTIHSSTNTADSEDATQVLFEVDPSNNVAAFKRKSALSFFLQTKATNDKNIPVLAGIQGQIGHYGTGTVSYMWGGNFWCGNESTGTAGTMVASTSMAENDAGTVTTAIGSSNLSSHWGGTTSTGIGGKFVTECYSPGTLSAGYGALIYDAGLFGGTSAIVDYCGLAIEDMSGATNNTGLLLGTSVIPSGDWCIYSDSLNPSQFAGSIKAPAIFVGNNGVRFTSSYPSTGTAIQGDIAWNTSAADGSDIGWICIADGSPGTWRSMGKVSAFTMDNLIVQDAGSDAVDVTDEVIIGELA